MSSAARLHRVHSLLMTQPADARNPVSMRSVWATVFDVDVTSADSEDEIVSCLQAVRSEVGVARDQLALTEVPAELLEPAFSSLHQVASPAYLGGNWHNHHQQLSTPDVKKIFEWAEWSLSRVAFEDHADVPPEQLQELMGKLAELERDLAETKLPSGLQSFVKNHITEIRAALRVATVSGVRPLRRALSTIVGDVQTRGAQWQASTKASSATDPKAGNALERFVDLVKRTGEVCDSAEKISNVAGRVTSSIAPLLLALC